MMMLMHSPFMAGTSMLVYVASIPGGILADKFIGQKNSVLLGGLILIAGHSIFGG